MGFIKIIFLFLLAFCQFSFLHDVPAKPKGNEPLTKAAVVNGNPLCNNVVGLMNQHSNYNEDYIFDKSIYELHLDTLAQVKFWRSIMNLHQDSSLVNIASNRVVLEKINNRDWNLKNDSLKNAYRDSIRYCHYLDTTQRIYVTAGKKFFYDFDKTCVNFHRGINCFINNSVDPWYSQAILLIESPNKLQKSNAGAYGPFQLMKDVARMYGLKVNKHMDERADFDRSAYAASSLLKKICIPNARKMLDSLKIANYNEHELWFRLLVMHIYHAGTYNVQSAVYACNPCRGDMDLIYNLWKTQTKRFKSASQNYSQLILAAMVEMDARNHNLRLAGL